MPIHVRAEKDDIAQVVLLPGDPDRSQYIAEKYLDSPKLYTEYRRMLGYTGLYKGNKVSIQTTGMGTPSISIVLEELIMLGAQMFIRLGTCGSINENIGLGDIIAVTSASSTNNIYGRNFQGACISAVADFDMVQSLTKNIPEECKIWKGQILTSDSFYEENYDLYKKFAEYNHLAVEMEAYALFVLCAKHRKKAATLLTVSDNVFHHLQRAHPDVIQNGVDAMTKIVLEALQDLYKFL